MADRRRNIGIPAGVVFPFAGTVAPYGYLLCNGDTISRAEYPQLFLAIGTSHGIGDGSTTFNLPDYRGRFLRGVDGDAGNDVDKGLRLPTNGGNPGNAVGSVQDDAMQGHGHNWRGNKTGAVAGGGSQWVIRGNVAGDTNYTDGSGSGTDDLIQDPSTQGAYGSPKLSTESRPKNVNVNYIIKI